MSERLLSPKEAAKILGVHPLTLYRWAKSGKIKYIETPTGRMKYPMSEIQRLLKIKGKKQIERLYRVVLYVKHVDEEKAQSLVKMLMEYAKEKNYIVVDTIMDISSEICGKTKAMEKLLELIKSRRVGKVVVPNKLSLSYFCFWVFEELFSAYDTTIEVAFEKDDKEAGYIEMLDWLMKLIKERRERYPI